MKKIAVLIMVVALFLSGCGIPRTVMTETAVVESLSEPIISETSQTTADTTLETTQAPADTTHETTQAPDTTHETTQTPADTILETIQLPADTTLETTKTPIKTTVEITADPTSDVSQTTLQPSAETTQVPAETSHKVTEATKETEIAAIVDREYLIMLKRDVLVLMFAYPEYVAGVEMRDEKAYLVMKSGKLILYDDKKEKTFDEKITDADVQDMLETLYPLSETNTLMSTDFDPGRTRAYSFIEEIYGNSKDVILEKLISVNFGDEHLPFNKEAGAAAALASAADGAARLVSDQPQVADYLYPSSGTFNYRVIAGTNRLSPHAYGIAIDLRSNPNGYWRWASPADGEALIKIYPQDLVRLFEKNGFIWGGKWNHFDLFHFEYRPEIIIKARYSSEAIDMSKPWYQGVNFERESASEFIAQIDKSLG